MDGPVHLAAARPLRRREQALPLVVADGVDGKARFLGKVVDPPAVVVHQAHFCRSQVARERVSVTQDTP